MSIHSHLVATGNWIDDRTGIKSLLPRVQEEEIPGGAKFSYVFGSALLFVFVLQLFTGILLLLYYVPTSDHAHTSVAYIQKEVLCGAIIRGIHHYGSSAMVILVVLHFLQTFLWGAYKKKRELLWLVGILLFLLVLGFSFTGYLLPWDQKAYFGTKVGVSIMSTIPIIGSTIERIVLGGSNLSTLTLSRFFVIHVVVLPLILGISSIVHILLFWYAKPAGAYTSKNLEEKTETFYPKQFFLNAVFSSLIFIVLLSISLYMPASLEPQANPADVNYIARPEWYFLPLFQLLKYFNGRLVLLPTMIIPGLIFTVLGVLPFFDRKQERNPFKRPICSVIASLLLLAIIGLMVIAKLDDKNDPLVSKRLAQQSEEAKEFLHKPFVAQSVNAQTIAQTTKSPAIYIEKCAGCHGNSGEGVIGPNLHNLNNKPKRTHNDLINLIKKPSDFGLNNVMPAFTDLKEKDYEDLSSWILSLN